MLCCFGVINNNTNNNNNNNNNNRQTVAVFSRYSITGRLFLAANSQRWSTSIVECLPARTAALQVNSALHPSGVAKSSTSFGWGKGRNVTSAGWQVTLCDPMWHVSTRSGVATSRTAIHLLLTYLLTYLSGLSGLQSLSPIKTDSRCVVIW